jgi:hypothetical protein
VKFLNPHAIKIVGHFAAHGKELVIDNDEMLFGGNRMAKFCFANVKVGIYVH